jgi:hypothetical protein
MRTYIVPFLLSLAVASPAVEEPRNLNALQQYECQLVSAVVNALKGAATATSFCSSLLRIPTATVTTTSTSTSTSVSTTRVFETITTTSVLTATESTITGTTTLTADTVTSTVDAV